MRTPWLGALLLVSLAPAADGVERHGPPRPPRLVAPRTCLAGSWERAPFHTTHRVQYGLFRSFTGARAYAARLSRLGLQAALFLTPDIPRRGADDPESYVVVSAKTLPSRARAGRLAAAAIRVGVPAFPRRFTEATR